MSVLEGKGFFIWKVAKTEGGVISNIASLAQSSGFSHVVVKIADGTYAYNVDSTTNTDLALAVTNALKAINIKVWGWHYIYGDDPTGEAKEAIQRIKALNLDGYVIDAESEFEASGMSTAATKFIQVLRSSYPSLPIALSSFRFPNYHMGFPWIEFLTYCDINMPQVYWVGSHNPATQLVQCINQFKALSVYKPIIPTGIACYENSWCPTSSDISSFLDEAHKTLNLPAANFWDWQESRSQLPALFTLISSYSWPVTTTTLTIVQKYINALNTLNADTVAALYQSTAIMISSSRTIQGTTAIRAYFLDLFQKTLPNGKFTLSTSSNSGNTWHLTWTATSTNGSVTNGNDTIGVIDGQISYHYTSFTAPTAS